MTESTTALATVDRTYQGLQMAMAPAEALRRVQELQAFVKEVMVQGEDYGVIPGTEKPTLLQPGAQKLAEIYGLAPHFADVTVVEDWDKPFFHYRKKCIRMSRRSGDVVAEGVGACNSREDRYAFRWCFESELPAGTDKRILQRREKNSRKTGKPYVQYRLPNPDLCSLVNTIEKMANKRAYVSAVISATRSAGIFTQDAEDLPAEVFGTADKHRSWNDEAEAAAVADAADASEKPANGGEQKPQVTVPEATIMEWGDALAQATAQSDVERVSQEISARKAELSKRTLQDLGKAKRTAEDRIKSRNQLPSDQDRGSNPDAY